MKGAALFEKGLLVPQNILTPLNERRLMRDIDFLYEVANGPLRVLLPLLEKD